MFLQKSIKISDRFKEIDHFHLKDEMSDTVYAVEKIMIKEARDCKVVEGQCFFYVAAFW